MNDWLVQKPEWDGNNREGVLLSQNMLEHDANLELEDCRSDNLLARMERQYDHGKEFTKCPRNTQYLSIAPAC